jgi:hypothetical protein
VQKWPQAGIDMEQLQVDANVSGKDTVSIFFREVTILKWR